MEGRQEHEQQKRKRRGTELFIHSAKQLINESFLANIEIFSDMSGELGGLGGLGPQICTSW